MSVRYDIHPDKAAAGRAAGELLAAAAEAGAQIALSGGSTVGAAFDAATTADWSRASVWWGDERCVPPDDERSNFALAKLRLLDRLPHPPAVHRVRGELPPDEAASLYDAELEGVVIDLALNGIGSDGHTASLFPGAPQLAVSDRRAVTAAAGLAPFVDRVTMTVPYLCASRTLVFLASGADKAEAVRRAFAEPPDPATPASLVRSATGETIVVLDREAASLLDI